MLRRLRTISDLLSIEVNRLETHYRVILIHPYVYSNYQRLHLLEKMRWVIESGLFTNLSPFLVSSCQRTSPFLRLRFLSTDDHSTFFINFPRNMLLFFHLLTRLLLKLHHKLRPRWLRYIGNQMLNIKLILINLILNLLLNLINTSIILTLQLRSIIIIITKQRLLIRFKYLLHLDQLQFQGLDYLIAILMILL